VGIRLLILSGKVFNSAKISSLQSQVGAVLVRSRCICGLRGLLLVEFKLSGGEEGLVGGSEPAIEVNEDDSMTTGNVVERGLE